MTDTVQVITSVLLVISAGFNLHVWRQVRGFEKSFLDRLESLLEREGK